MNLSEKQMTEDYVIVWRTKEQAANRLKQLYAEACERFPLTRMIPETLYIKANLRAARKYAVPLETLQEAES